MTNDFDQSNKQLGRAKQRQRNNPLKNVFQVKFNYHFNHYIAVRIKKNLQAIVVLSTQADLHRIKFQLLDWNNIEIVFEHWNVCGNTLLG